jgi:type IV pilus assembly protein PilQ
MFLLSRITLLGLFATIGVGLALCVAFTTSPPEELKPAASKTLAVPRLERRDTSRQRELTSLHVPLRKPADETLEESTSSLHAPGPVVAEPYPARTYQVQAEADPRLLKLLETLQNRLGPQPTPAPGTPQSTPAAAPGSPQPTLAPGVTLPPGAVPPTTVRMSEPRARIVPSHPGEGDGRLSINLQDADVREVLELLSAQGNLNILASNSVQGKITAVLNGVDLNSALDAILRTSGLVARREGNFIYVGSPQEFEQIEQMLDRVGTRVYRPNYVAAQEMQALLQPLVTPKVGVVTVSTPAEAGIGSDADKAGGNKFAGGEVILVRDYEAVLAQIDQMVTEIDIQPMQVAIEAMILSIKLTDKDKLGVNWQLLREKQNLKLSLGTPAQTLPTTFTSGGLAFAFLDSNLGAFINALEELNETNVIATPRLMVMNKQRAEIQIGRQQGYVSSTVQTETSTTSNMQMLDTGTILRLRPFISPDGMIRMEVHPELSTGEVVEKANTLVPDKEITQVTSNIAVRDGCTLIIGGLMREELKVTGNQLPVLGNLPYVGALFRNREETQERHEILVLITPHIIYQPEANAEGTKAAGEFHRRQAVIAEKMSPLSRQAVGRRYFRLAQNAWACGDRDTALRFAEISVQFDPQNRAAIDLRANIWTGTPIGDHTLCGPAPAPPTAPLDQATVSPWLLDELQREPAPAAMPMHPLDPGVPGTHKDIVRPRKLP